MMSRFFPSATATANLLGLLGMLVAPALSAQTAAPGPGGGTPKPKVAHVRFLNLLPLDSSTLQVFVGAGTEGQPLQTAPPSNFYAGYTTFPSVRTTYRVFRLGDRQTPLKSVDVPLKPEGYFTMMARLQPDGQPTVEVIDETPDPAVPPVNQLTVRQFYRGAQVVVTAGGRQRSGLLGYGETQAMANLPDGIVPLVIVATMTAGGLPKTLNVDANLQRARHATIFIVTDPYDRLRPRVISDGPSRAEEDAAAAAFRGNAAPPATSPAP